MKKPMYILAFAASLVMVACGGEENTEAATEEAVEEVVEAVEEVVEEAAEEASIVGEWQLTDMDMGVEVPADQMDAFKASIANTKYNFTEDGKMIINSDLGTQEGTYAVDGSTLNTTVDGKEEAVDVAELTANSLVLSMTIEETKMTMTFSK